ncbi:hypothetical protein WMW72_20935 [Paenibacillus filicis]|uniref:Uncharacterized protein n=1 Tax=Paenibacillus filicis TaxID=669464 RepID=A0ABU9DND0_9BACL
MFKAWVLLSAIIAGVLYGKPPVVTEVHPPPFVEKVESSGQELLQKQQLLIVLREQAKQGRLEGVETPLGSSFQEVIAAHESPEEIANDECWTYSYGHSQTKATFYYAHDSCSEELNHLRPDTILNKISVTPDFFRIRISEEDVKETLGKPAREYSNEAYGGYYMNYELQGFMLTFIASDEPPRKINRIQVIRTE